MDQIQDYSQFNRPPYLLEQFRGTDVEKLAAIPDGQFNDLEAAAFALLAGVWIDDAAGAQLDVIGLHLDFARSGRADETYRTMLKVKAFVDTSSGTPEALITAVRSLYQATQIEYIPNYPGKITLRQNGQINAFMYFRVNVRNGNQLATKTGKYLYFRQPDTISESFLYDIVPAGVKLTLESI